MATAVITSKGQITIPKSVRERLRVDAGDRVEFVETESGVLPPDDKSVIVEVYPSIFRNRYAKEKRTADEHDGYSVARWLSESAARGILDHYFTPPLTPEERQTAEIEGWILGVA